MVIFQQIMGFINNSLFLSAAIAAFIVIIVCKALYDVLGIIRAVRNLIENKSNKIALENELSLRTQGYGLSDSLDRVDITNSVLNFINDLVHNEVIDVMTTYRELNTVYEVSKIDKDIERISTSVYQSLADDLYEDPNLIIKDEAILRYISRVAKLDMINTVSKFNEIIRNPGEAEEAKKKEEEQ